MKNFNLKAYGVVEASKEEMMETNGGWITFFEMWSLARQVTAEARATESASASFAGDITSDQFGPPSMPV